MSSNKLITWLFDTKAVRISPEDNPFWYTSGTIGPYYINTHFLYGSEEKANALLKEIDVLKSNKLDCPVKLFDLVKKNYQNDSIFKGLIDEMLLFIMNHINIETIDYISGGERRDWFFSLIISDLLNKPHITIFKDLTAVVSQKGETQEIDRIPGSRVLHIADLITEASSYERAWIPAIRNMGAEMPWSLVVIDRKQGGGELLDSYNVISYAMTSIDKSLFSGALEMGLINSGQYAMLLEYLDNPKESMKRFLHNHPDFLENSLNGDEKTKDRAKLCIEKRIYK